MDKRILVACIVALGTLLGFDLLTQVSGGKLDLPLRTPLGTILVGNLLTTFAAMTLGGWIARRPFRWIAVALGAVVWAATIAVLVAIAPSTGAGAGATMSLPDILKFNALAIVLSLAASWLGAVLGEHLAARRRLPITA